jgi:pimeloyl-ACP methyl ester carboxylesterase
MRSSILERGKLMLILQLAILLGTIIVVYLIISLGISLFLANFPRRSVNDIPDWGVTKDCRVPTINGKMMECWVVYPKKLKSVTDETVLKRNPAIMIIHGWGRNRGRVVSKARIFGQLGYTTVLPSVRDHGNSDKELTGMSIVRFSQDVESCLNWWGQPVILNGHSIGAGAILIVAARNHLVKAVIAEATPYAFPYGLKHVYRPALKWFLPFLLPGITLVTMIKFRKNTKTEYSPLDAAPGITAPTLLIHGRKDPVFPHKYAILLEKDIKNCRTWILDEADHSDFEEHPEYGKRVTGFIKSL